MIRCMAPKLTEKVEGEQAPTLLQLLAAVGGERCGEPAAFKDRTGRPLCALCAEQARKNHLEGATLLSILSPGTLYPLYPIQ